MTIEEAKAVAQGLLDDLRGDVGNVANGGRAATREAGTTLPEGERRIEAVETLLRALGEPTPEDREAAGWHARQAGDPPSDEAYAMYRRAAEALLRSPAAIRRAAFEEAAQVCSTEAADCLTPEGRAACLNLAGQIRALDGGAL